MRSRLGVLVVAALMVLTGCTAASSDDAGGPPSASSTAAPSPASAAEALLRGAQDELTNADETVFTSRQLVDGKLATATLFSVAPGSGDFAARTVSPDAKGRPVSSTLLLVAGTAYLTVAAWPRAQRSCWLPFTGDVGSSTPLDMVSAWSAGPVDRHGVMAATASLPQGLSFLNEISRQTLGVPRDLEGTLPVTLRFDDQRLDSMVVRGADLLEALRAADASPSPSVAVALPTFEWRVRWRPGDPGMPLEKPAAGTLMTDEAYAAGRGCAQPEGS
jgi:hypothetical protein